MFDLEGRAERVEFVLACGCALAQAEETIGERPAIRVGCVLLDYIPVAPQGSDCTCKRVRGATEIRLNATCSIVLSDNHLGRCRQPPWPVGLIDFGGRCWSLRVGNPGSSAVKRRTRIGPQTPHRPAIEGIHDRPADPQSAHRGRPCRVQRADCAAFRCRPDTAFEAQDRSRAHGGRSP